MDSHDAVGSGSRRRGVQHVLEVTGTEVVSPHMVRVRFGGPAVQAFLDEADRTKLATSDKYVKLLIAKPGLGLTPPFDLETLRQRLSGEDLPVRRTYTIRLLDEVAGTLAIDFVVHGDEGVGGPCAAAAAPGDMLALSGPGGGFVPSRDVALPRLILGDESALPAIAAVLESMPAEAHGTALLEVDGPGDELDLERPPHVSLHWLHRNRAAPGALLPEAARKLGRPRGPVEVFAHGERAAIKQLRALLSDDWGIDRASLSLSPYWASGRSEDGFQAEKRMPVGAIFDS